MQPNRRQSAGSSAGLEISNTPAHSARARGLGKLVRRVQGLEFAACDASGSDEANSGGITTASINRLHTISVSRHPNSIQAEPPSPFVLFLL